MRACVLIAAVPFEGRSGGPGPASVVCTHLRSASAGPCGSVCTRSAGCAPAPTCMPSGAGEQAGDGSRAGGLPVQVELGVDVAQVALDGADAQGQGLGDGVVVEALGRRGAGSRPRGPRAGRGRRPPAAPAVAPRVASAAGPVRDRLELGRGSRAARRSRPARRPRPRARCGCRSRARRAAPRRSPPRGSGPPRSRSSGHPGSGPPGWAGRAVPAGRCCRPPGAGDGSCGRSRRRSRRAGARRARCAAPRWRAGSSAR